MWAFFLIFFKSPFLEVKKVGEKTVVLILLSLLEYIAKTDGRPFKLILFLYKYLKISIIGLYVPIFIGVDIIPNHQ